MRNLVIIDGSNFYHKAKAIAPNIHLSTFGYRKLFEGIIGNNDFFAKLGNEIIRFEIHSLTILNERPLEKIKLPLSDMVTLDKQIALIFSHFDGKKQDELAASLGVSQSTISRLMNKDAKVSILLKRSFIHSAIKHLPPDVIFQLENV